MKFFKRDGWFWFCFKLAPYMIAIGILFRWIPEVIHSGHLYENTTIASFTETNFGVGFCFNFWSMILLMTIASIITGYILSVIIYIIGNILRWFEYKITYREPVPDDIVSGEPTLST